MKKYNSYILENLSLDIDTIISILKITREKDIDLFNKIINKDKMRLLKDAKKSKNKQYINYILNHVDDDIILDQFDRNMLFGCKNKECFDFYISKGMRPLVDKYDWNLVYFYIRFHNFFDETVFDTLIDDMGVNIEEDNNELLSYSFYKYDQFMYFIKKGLVVNKTIARKITNSIGTLEYHTKKEIVNFLKIFKYIEGFNSDIKQNKTFKAKLSLFIKIYDTVYKHIDNKMLINNLISNTDDGITYKDKSHKNNILKIKHMLNGPNGVSVYKTIENIIKSEPYHSGIKDILKNILSEFSMIGTSIDFNI